MGKYIQYKKLEEILEKERPDKKVVLTGGCFDLFHKGHLSFLNKVRKYGDILVVNVVSDERVKSYKGQERPIQGELERARIIGSLEIVDYSTIYDAGENDAIPGLAVLVKPEIIVQNAKKWKWGDKQRLRSLLGYKVELIGIERCTFQKSTTTIIKKIVKNYYKLLQDSQTSIPLNLCKNPL